MVEDGEAELTTALREVKEETGLLLPDLWLFEDLKREVTYQEWKFWLFLSLPFYCLQNPQGVEFTGSYWLTMLIDYNKKV